MSRNIFIEPKIKSILKNAKNIEKYTSQNIFANL